MSWPEMDKLAVVGLRATGLRVEGVGPYEGLGGRAVSADTMPGFCLVVFDGDSIVQLVCSKNLRFL